MVAFMLVLGHLATTGVAAGWVGKNVDLRWVLVFGLLADLFDKPIGLLLFRESFNNGRIYGHSLLFNLVLTLLLMVLHKPRIYSLALWLHQFCDLMWTRPGVALWPFTGPFTYRDLPLEQWVIASLSPYHLVAEVVGFVVVLSFVSRNRLLDRKRLSSWLRTGRLSLKRSSTYQGIKRLPREEVGKDAGNLVYGNGSATPSR